jgi:hypothetical protein
MIFEPIYKRERAQYRNSPDDIVVLYDPVKLLTKEIKRNPVTGIVPKKPAGYPAKSFLSIPSIIGFRNIYDLSRILTELAREPHCTIIRGNPFEAAYGLETPIMRRYKHAETWTNHYEAVVRRWLAADIDGLILPNGMRLCNDAGGVAAWIVGQVALFLQGLAGVTVHVQFTSSAGMNYIPGHGDYGKPGPEKVSARIWAVLDRPYSNADLTRWCEAANVSWSAAGGGGKLIDTSPVKNAVGPNYTADPVLEGVEPPLPQRSFLVLGPRLEASPVIPTEAAIEQFTRERGISSGLIPHGIGYNAALDFIGDYCFPGKQGFQEPILATCRAAVSEQGADVDGATVIADVQARIALFRGARTNEEIIRYGSDAFILAKLHHYQRRLADREVEAEARIRLARPAPRACQSLDDGQRELAEAARQAVEKCIVYRRSRELYDLLCTAGREPKEARVETKRQLGLKRWPKRPVIVLNATLGLGKTRALLKAIRDALDGLPAPVPVDWYAPSYSLLEPTVAGFSALGCRVPHRVIRGRSQPDHEKRLERLLGGVLRQDQTDRMCAYWRAAEAVAHAGKSVSRNLCSTCVLRAACGYYAQFADDRPHVNFMPHAYLTVQRPEGLPPAAFAVIDENPAAAAFKDLVLDVGALLADMRVLLLLGAHATPEQHDAIWTGVRWLRELIWSSWRTADAPIAAIATALEFCRERGIEKVSVVDGDDSVIAAMSRWLPTDRYALLQLFEQLIRCHQNGVELRDTIQIAADNRSLRMARFDWLKISDRQPIIILDATADYHQIAAIFGQEPEWIDIQVKQNLHVTQIVGLSGSKSSLYGYDASMPKHYLTKDHADLRSSKLSDIVDKIRARAAGRPSLLITHKETAEYLAGTLPSNFALRHFGDLRGHNDYEGVEFVCVLGRQLALLRDLERQRAAMLAMVGNDPMRPFISTAFFAERLSSDAPRPNGYFISETTGEIYHPDPIINAMMKESSVNEIIQGVGRARAVRSSKTIDVLLLSDIVIPDLAPDVTETLLNFHRAGKRTKFQDYLARELSGDPTAIRVAPLDTATMCARAPDLFISPKSAEKARTQLPNEIDVAFIEAAIGSNFPIRGARTPLTSLIEPGDSACARDTIKDVRGVLEHYENIALGDYLTLGSRSYSKFIAIAPSNDQAGLTAALFAKVRRTIAGLKYRMIKISA